MPENLQNFEYTRSWILGADPEDSFPTLNYLKDWRSSSDFITYQPSETQVREDMQALFEEIKNYINGDFRSYVVATGNAESYRIANEEARIANEEARVANENQRQANETVRQSNETTRQTQEAAREAAEAARANENSGIVAQATAQAERAESAQQEAFRSMMNAGLHANRAAMYASEAHDAQKSAHESMAMAKTEASSASADSRAASAQRFYAERAATEAESYAKGGTGSRSGENTDNAKYYKEQSETIYTNVDRRFRVGLDNGLLCAKNISLTLTASGWSAGEPYIQTVNVGADALIADQAGHAFLSPGATDAQYAEANRCGIWLQSATTSTVTFRAMFAKPTADIPVGLELHFTPEALSASYATQADLEALTAADVGAVPTSEKGAQNGVATLGSDGKIPAAQVPALDYVPTTQRGAANGVASLDSSGTVPLSQIPDQSRTYVSTLRKINGKSLSDDISLNAEDVFARPAGWTPKASDLPIVPLAKGGTGANDKAGAKAALEIPDLPVSVANGGTGATTAAGARENLGLGDYETVRSAVTTLGQNVATLMQQSVRMTQGYYVGDGTYGADHQNVLTFDFTPVLVLVYTKNSVGRPISTHFMRGLDVAFDFTGKGNGTVSVSWTDNVVSWYAAVADWQGNVNGQVYYYIAIGYEAEG